ncbi:hypothetical protein BDV98DRAFT_571355 [Pterulicium gracile]|uniref:Uncharacterized protein n=1 Tax=Pterulicium gracile TaxID=1884261 RepID=A0A5C3QB51_9AGAR|nr:hypothetical protein BDV98DRAFT_571355 [Pterula gracilis]
MPSSRRGVVPVVVDGRATALLGIHRFQHRHDGGAHFLDSRGVSPFIPHALPWYPQDHRRTHGRVPQSLHRHPHSLLFPASRYPAHTSPRRLLFVVLPIPAKYNRHASLRCTPPASHRPLLYPLFSPLLLLAPPLRTSISQRSSSYTSQCPTLLHWGTFLDICTAGMRSG